VIEITRKLMIIGKPPICPICKKPVTKSRDLEWFEYKGKPAHWHCTEYMRKKEEKEKSL